jgi:subfamily B ATP-binding cassette protein MsbA
MIKGSYPNFSMNILLRYSSKILIVLIFILSLFIAVFDGFGIGLIVPLLNTEANELHFKIDNNKFGILSDFQIDFTLGMSQGILLVVAIFLVKGILRFSLNFLRVKMRSFFINRLRLDLFKAIYGLNHRSFNDLTSDTLYSLLNNEVQKLFSAFDAYFKSWSGAIQVFAYFMLAIFLYAKFTIMLLMSSVLVLLFYRRIYFLTKSASSNITNHHGTLSKVINTFIYNWEYFKINNDFDNPNREFNTISKKIEQEYERIGWLQSFAISSREFLSLAVVLFIVFIEVVYFKQDIKSTIVPLVLLYRIMGNSVIIQNSWNSYLMSFGSIKKITDFLENYPSQSEVKLMAHQDSLTNIVFNEVAFKYDGSQEYVVNNINFSINRGELLLLKGASGSGKTTILRLLTGLLMPLKGEILFDGKVKSISDFEIFRNHITYMSSRHFILGGELEQLFAEFNSSLNLNNEVNRITHHINLKHLFNGATAPKESQLSAGELQRINIIRTLLNKAEIWILDEPTSQLDFATTKLVVNEVNRLKVNSIVIVISHGIEFDSVADKIIQL